MFFACLTIPRVLSKYEEHFEQMQYLAKKFLENFISRKRLKKRGLLENK